MPDIRDISYKGFYAQIRSDDVWFTVYDAFDEPCGTIRRPERYGNGGWQAYVATGAALTKTAVGPNQCLRSIAIYNGA